ncbi:hypothetical protein BLOT_015673 [Blomia tropicalis]|nr:hypothetical protein BLOT_015673 [Blomia tropicalis]
MFASSKNSPKFYQNLRFKSNWYDMIDQHPEDAFHQAKMHIEEQSKRPLRSPHNDSQYRTDENMRNHEIIKIDGRRRCRNHYQLINPHRVGKNVPNTEHPFPLIKNIFRKVKNKSYYVLATRFVYQDEDFMIIDVIGKRFHVIEVANFNTSSFKLVPPIEVEHILRVISFRAMTTLASLEIDQR